MAVALFVWSVGGENLDSYVAEAQVRQVVAAAVVLAVLI